MHVLRKSWEGPTLTPLDDLKTLWQAEVKAKAELLTSCLSVEDIPTEDPKKDVETNCFQVLK